MGDLMSKEEKGIDTEEHNKLKTQITMEEIRAFLGEQRNYIVSRVEKKIKKTLKEMSEKNEAEKTEKLP